MLFELVGQSLVHVVVPFVVSYGSFPGLIYGIFEILDHNRNGSSNPMVHWLGLQYVIKRDGRQEPVHFDKITARITKLSYGLNTDFCDPVRVLLMGLEQGNLSAASSRVQSWWSLL